MLAGPRDVSFLLKRATQFKCKLNQWYCCDLLGFNLTNYFTNGSPAKPRCTDEVPCRMSNQPGGSNHPDVIVSLHVWVCSGHSWTLLILMVFTELQRAEYLWWWMTNPGGKRRSSCHTQDEQKLCRLSGQLCSSLPGLSRWLLIISLGSVTGWSECGKTGVSAPFSSIWAQITRLLTLEIRAARTPASHFSVELTCETSSSLPRRADQQSGDVCRYWQSCVRLQWYVDFKEDCGMKIDDLNTYLLNWY